MLHATFQIQVLGTCGSLSGDLGVNLDGVEVVFVSWNDDIVPVVVVKGSVGVPFDQMGSVPQVWHIMQVPAPKRW